MFDRKSKEAERVQTGTLSKNVPITAMDKYEKARLEWFERYG